MMRTISGNYPEVWIGYKITGSPEEHWFIVQDVHTVDLAWQVFVKEPPKLPLGISGRVVAVHYWHNAMHWDSVIPPVENYRWQTDTATNPS